MSSKASNLLADIVAEFESFAKPLTDALRRSGGIYDLLAMRGWNLTALKTADLSTVSALVDQLQQSLMDLQEIQSFEDLQGIVKTLGDLGKALNQVQSIQQTLASVASVRLTTPQAEALTADVMECLVLAYMRRCLPKTYTALIALTLVEVQTAETLVDSTGMILRYPIQRPVLRLDYLGKLLSDPLNHLKLAYFPSGGVTNEAAAIEFSTRLFGRLETIVQSFGGRATAGLRDPLESELSNPQDPSFARSLTVAFSPPTLPIGGGATGLANQFGSTFVIIPADGHATDNTSGPALEVVPFGLASFETHFGSWAVALTASGTVSPLVISDQAVHFMDPSASRFGLQLAFSKGQEGQSAMLIGGGSGTRLEIDKIRLSALLELVTKDRDYGFSLDLNKVAVIITAGDGDGFLQKILPKDGIQLDFGLTVGWSNKRGLYFGGSAGLETTLAVNIDLFGIIKIDSVYVALEAKEDSKKKESGIRAATATTVQVKLGPVSAIVERFGLQATLSFPEKGGNLGVANLDLGFKPPNGVGLTINAQVVTGGGYLYFDTEKEQYAGVLQLEIAQKFSLTAVGLLTTKMPDGSKGFSLLVIISVRFDPGIQLGYGFSLNGLGGLLGVNRTVTTEVLRDGLRRGALGSVLFPQNVVENAPQIISNLSKIFPPAQDRFLFGPMAIIGWGGSPPILSMEIGIILELPEPVRLIILGRLSVTLPGKSDESSQAGGSGTDGEEKRQDTPKIKLQLDSLGIIDFGSGDISLDAYLYDSTIGPFTITGGMALRASFGARPMFLLSVGGFHPAFQVPAGFPSIDRVAISLNKREGDVEVRLQLSAYFALTSNTVQFGAHLDLLARIGGGKVVGLLAFDALIQFQPFGLIASFEAMVALSWEGFNLLSVGLQMNLTGPSPWHAWGKAYFEILGMKQSAEFSVVTGPAEPPHLPPPINVEEKLLEELQKASNWSSQLPVGEHPLVTFRDSIPPKDPAATPPQKRVLVHPLAELHINQRLVPLKADPITRYGTTTPTGATTFALEVTEKEKTPSTSALTVSDLSDWFALAQFYAMSDTQKLSAPSFEEKNSGVRVKAEEGYSCGKPVESVIKEARSSDNEPISELKAEKYLDQVAHLGAAGQAPIRAAGPAKYGDPTWWDQGITLGKAEYRVVGEEDDSTEPNARATQRAGAPSPSSLFEKVMDDMAAIAEPAMSYSAAQTRATRARQRSPRRRMWVVPDIGVTRGAR
ncbi:MAG: hypothetical protein LV473_06465 [Nitrospira sp.]|nr:hypothetical protein [Nitrospira sp.]